MITIDRTKPFDPEAFIGKGWTIVNEDRRSLAITQIDPAQIHIHGFRAKPKTSVSGETSLKRLKRQGDIRLDAKVFQFFWENKKEIPESWEQGKKGYKGDVHFDGTILKSPEGYYHTLYIRVFSGKHYWSLCWLKRNREDYYPSAVITSNKVARRKALVAC